MLTNSKQKKILILGATKSEFEIIRKAQEKGFYVLVTDSHENWKDAPAKYIADEAWNISWSDIPKLKAACEKNQIDAVIAGFSEKRVFAANSLSIAINRPFYANGADLDTLFDKYKFKQACVNAGIRVPQSYTIDSDVHFPVIVKPADNGGSRGISICYDRDELNIAYEKAMNWSDAKQVLIEEYLTADEIMVYFTVCNGEVILSAMCDRLMKRFDDRITQLPVAYYYPSKYLEIFTKYNFEKFKRLLHDLKIQNGLIAFQSFVIGNDVIPFDPTYRLDGTRTFYFTEYNNQISALDMLIHYSVYGEMGDYTEIVSKEDPHFQHVTFEFPVLLKKGTIAKVSGIEEARKTPGVVALIEEHAIGDVMEKEADFSQMLCRVFVCTDSITELKKIVAQVFSLIQVESVAGEDMILFRLDPETVFKCYEG